MFRAESVMQKQSCWAVWLVFTVGVDVASFFHLQEEPVESPMAVEAKPAALSGKQLGKEHGPTEPSAQAKSLCEGQSDAGLEAKVCHEDKVPSVASSRQSVTIVAETPLEETSPSSAEEGVSSLGLHVFAASESFSSFLQCFPRLLHFLFFPFIMTALVIMLEECVADNMFA